MRNFKSPCEPGSAEFPVGVSVHTSGLTWSLALLCFASMSRRSKNADNSDPSDRGNNRSIKVLTKYHRKKKVIGTPRLNRGSKGRSAITLVMQATSMDQKTCALPADLGSCRRHVT